MTPTPLWFRVCLLGWASSLLWLGLRYQRIGEAMMGPVVLVGVIALIFATRQRMLRLSQRENAILLIVNMIGTCMYVWRASYGWFYPEAPEIYPTGEPFIWAAAIFPVVAIFFPLNISWGGVILGTRQWKSGRYWLMVAAMWMIALVIDFTHH